jgi:hypothetical protein
MGILFLIVIMFAPKGAAGALKRLWDSIASRPSEGGTPAKRATEDSFYEDTQ